jgi:hypothetical protein
VQLAHILDGWVGKAHSVLGIGAVTIVIDADDSAIVGCERARVAEERTTVGRGRRGSGARSGSVGASGTETTNSGSHNRGRGNSGGGGASGSTSGSASSSTSGSASSRRTRGGRSGSRRRSGGSGTRGRCRGSRGGSCRSGACLGGWATEVCQGLSVAVEVSTRSLGEGDGILVSRIKKVVEELRRRSLRLGTAARVVHTRPVGDESIDGGLLID